MPDYSQQVDPQLPAVITTDGLRLPIGGVDQGNGTAAISVSASVSVSGAPLTGGATGVAPAVNQSIGLAGYNASTSKMDALQVDASDNLKVAAIDNLTQVASTTLGAPTAAGASASGNVLGVQGVTGGVALPVSGSVAVSSLPATPAGSNAIGTVGVTALPALPAGSNAIGSISQPYAMTTGQAAVASSAVGAAGSYFATLPTLTDTQVNPILLDSSGRLLVSVKTSSNVVSLTPAVTASSAYSIGNEVGPLLVFTNAFRTSFSGVLESISISVLSTQSQAYKLYVFNANPSGSTWADKTAPAIVAADIPKCVGVYNLGAYDNGLSASAFTIYTIEGVSKVIKSVSTTLYAVLTTVSAVTYASTSDVTINVGILQD